MRRICIALATFALAFSFAACDADTATYEDQTDETGGFGSPGMTYNGKLGYDNGLGQIQPYDGSAPGFGFDY